MPADATRLRSQLRTWSRRVGENWRPELVEAMRAEAPISTPTPTSTRAPGELRRAVRATPTVISSTGVRFRLEARVLQAVTTNLGARPHVIRPRSAGGVLRFHWPKAGGVVHLRQVNHPGNRPTRWWDKGLAKHAQPTLTRAARRTPRG